jgi:hypothetical protein
VIDIIPILFTSVTCASFYVQGILQVNLQRIEPKGILLVDMVGIIISFLINIFMTKNPP